MCDHQPVRQLSGGNFNEWDGSSMMDEPGDVSLVHFSC
jgi:hypothetical protein